MREDIRNFSIIAHIDHGKSTLADRILELTKAVSAREMRDQVLDDMDLEREKGITIKAKAIRLEYAADDGKKYTLNLIDTPGHVDFTYEVARSLVACEGTLLVVDAAQGVEAQTLANVYLANENNLKIIPVINKIDLPNADILSVKHQIMEIMDGDEAAILQTSAKLGKGIKEVLEAIVHQIPPPRGSPDGPLSALVFDSVFDPYRGAVIYVRVFDGTLRQGMKIEMMSTGKKFEVDELGVFHLKMVSAPSLEAGEVGYLVAGIKDIHSVKIGDTIIDPSKPGIKPYGRLREVKPFVFCGLYPVNTADYEHLKKALERLRLNDASFEYQAEDSVLGYGFRCGFLGLLHMEIVRERLEREYNLALVVTAPNVIYRIKKIKGTKRKKKDSPEEEGEIIYINNPADLPPESEIAEIAEPLVKVTIILPGEFLGGVMKLMEKRRSKFISMKYINPQRVILTYELPLAEMIAGFYDRLKSVSRGFASLDYQHIGYKAGDLAKLVILINYEPVEALSVILPREKAYYRAQKIAKELKEVIPRQQIPVPIQAKIENRIIARETIRAFRKDVTAKLYGGDVTRKRKLLEKQKEGKKKMKRLGKVDVPQEAFLTFLKFSEEE
ncbi:elongation factor 4 [bacterium]|nr:elongation factor 4 [bacterium]NIN92547.1 elongation factor 4 [bacterium]NIO18589.1 elongation factor 4 [bacterium]NIO73604.1 elongation factor 4 [bacterium]